MYRNWHQNFEYSDRLFGNAVATEAFFKTIEQELPPVVSRGELARITGGLISAKTLSNQDVLRQGPGERVRAGSKVGYTRAAVMAYLRKKLTML